MPRVFPNITKTLVKYRRTNSEAEGRPSIFRPVTIRKQGSNLNTLPEKDVGFGHDELELFSPQILCQSWERGGLFCYCCFFVCDLVFYIL